MDLKLFFTIFSLLYSVTRPNTVTESNDLPSQNFGKIIEGSALDSTPSKSLRTNGMFECAIICFRLRQCNYFNYQISLEQSGLCEVFQGYISVKEMDRLVLQRPGFVFVHKLTLEKSCLGHLRMGARNSGIFKVLDEKTEATYDVYCDFTTNPQMAWTLVSSRQNHKPLITPFFSNYPIDEEHPNWNDYRLSIGRMEALKNFSTHWRITCNFPIDGVDYRDYVRARFSEIDLIHFVGFGSCRQVEYINIRGYNCSSCSVPWWQASSSGMLHTDSYSGLCGIGLFRSGAVFSEDNFGLYGRKNTAFRCTKSPESTTNWWFGGYI